MKGNNFTFSAYMSPPPKFARDGKNVSTAVRDFLCDDSYDDVKACGFDSVVGLYEHTVEQFEKAIGLAAKRGISFIVRDQNDFSDNTEKVIQKIALGEDASLETEILFDRLDKYFVNANAVSLLAYDEPSVKMFTALAEMKKKFSERFPDKEFIVNLLPNYANENQLFGDENRKDDYRKYLEEFIGIVGTDNIYYDNYPLMIAEGKPVIREEYFSNLEDVANICKKYDKDFYVFLLTLGHWSFRTVKDYRDIAWQVYTAMAYGAAGALTFTYWTMLGFAPGNKENVTTALVTQDGKPTSAYYAMKEVIAEVKTFDKVYSGCKWVESACFLSENSKIRKVADILRNKSVNGIELLFSDNDALVGAFDCGKRKAYMIVNISDPADNSVMCAKVRFFGAEKIRVFTDGKQREETLVNGIYDFSVKSGGYCFIELL